MKFPFYYNLYCNLFGYFYPNCPKDLSNGKSQFERLPDHPIAEIMTHLDQKDKKQLSVTSKEFFKFDTREVHLSLPLTKSKKPSKFVCDHLKIRKELVLSSKDYYNDLSLSDSRSITNQYLKCLSGIETLRFGNFDDEKFILKANGFKIQKLFPKLRDLKFILSDDIPLNVYPNNLKTLNLYYLFDYQNGDKLKEKISQMDQLETLTLTIESNDPTPLFPMISQLKNLPNFKRLSIDYYGNVLYRNHLIAQTKNAHYFLGLNTGLKIKLDEFLKKLPKTTEALSLNFNVIEEPENVCDILTTFSHLKKLELKNWSYAENFGCLLRSLPSQLKELLFKTGDLGNTDIKKITLPKNLYSVTLPSVKSDVFEALANHVKILRTEIMDSKNFLKIEKPFTNIRTLIYVNDNWDMSSEAFIKLLDLLPKEMDMVDLYAQLENDIDIQLLEDKIFSFGKRIKKFILKASFLFSTKYYYREYEFNGSKMTRIK